MGTTLRTTASPYDRLTLTRLQAEIGALWLGAGTFAKLSTNQQNQINDILDDGGDRISAEGMGHYPWCRRAVTITLVVDQGLYNFPADWRRTVEMTETVGGKTRTLMHMPKHIKAGTWGASLIATHPAIAGSGTSSSSSDLFWTFEGHSSDNPPQPIFRRDPAPTEGGTIEAFYRPYFGKLADDSYIELVPEARRALKHYTKAILSADKGNKKQFELQMALFMSEINVLQQHADVASEEMTVAQTPGVFNQEVSGP